MRAFGRARVPAPDNTAERLEMHMLAAIARGDAALAAWASTRNVQHLVDGVLDVRNRLKDGLPVREGAST